MSFAIRFTNVGVIFDTDVGTVALTTFICHFLLQNVILKKLRVLLSGVTRVFGARGRSNEERPQSRDVDITPAVRFSVEDSLWLPELSFFNARAYIKRNVMQKCYCNGVTISSLFAKKNSRPNS